MIREGKREMDYDVKTELIVKFYRSINVDDKSLLKPFYDPGYYQVKAWTNIEDQFQTQVVRVIQGHYMKFNEEVVIPLDSSTQYLYIELLRGLPRGDPETSNGIVVMGRGKIKLPASTSRGIISGKASLVGLSSDPCVVEKGALEFAMKLHTYVEV